MHIGLLYLGRTLLLTHCRCHMFYPRRVLDINDGRPKWSGISGSSELIADSPEESKQHRKRQKIEEEEEKEDSK